MSKHLTCPDGQNNLIFTLSDADRALLESHLTPTDLDRRKVLEEPDTAIRHVYFPIAGIGSTIARGSEGRRIEAGLFGREGMSGMPILMETDRTPHETFMQVAGHGLVIAADAFRGVLEESPSIGRHFLRFVQAMAIQTAHTALSNGQAKLEERLARWLVMCHDRIDGDEMALTHEFLAVMLGVRRAGVTVGTHILEGKGMIRAGRGSIVILDREGLEDEARQSYGVPEKEYERLFG